jgi:hypothetical protein
VTVAYLLKHDKFGSNFVSIKQNLPNSIILPPKNGEFKAGSHSVRKANVLQCSVSACLACKPKLHKRAIVRSVYHCVAKRVVKCEYVDLPTYHTKLAYKIYEKLLRTECSEFDTMVNVND